MGSVSAGMVIVLMGGVSEGMVIVLMGGVSEGDCTYGRCV